MKKTKYVLKWDSYPKFKPFPWKCTCGGDVIPKIEHTYIFNYKIGKENHTTSIDGVLVPTCKKCGKKVLNKILLEMMEARMKMNAFIDKACYQQNPSPERPVNVRSATSKFAEQVMDSIQKKEVKNGH